MIASFPEARKLIAVRMHQLAMVRRSHKAIGQPDYQITLNNNPHWFSQIVRHQLTPIDLPMPINDAPANSDDDDMETDA